MDLYLAEKSLNEMIKTRLMMMAGVFLFLIPFVGLFIAPLFILFWGVKFYVAFYKLGKAISWCDVAFIFYIFADILTIFPVGYVRVFSAGLQLLAISIMVIAINGVIKKSTYVSVMYFGYVLILLKAALVGINIYTIVNGATLVTATTATAISNLVIATLVISIVSFIWEIIYYKMAIFVFDSPYLYSNDTYYY